MIAEETIAEAEAWGASEETLAKLRDAREDVQADTIEVEPENVDAVRLFLSVQTQWRLQPLSNGKVYMLARTGIDYTVLPVACAALCITLDEALLASLQILEGESLRLYAEHRERLMG